MLKVLSWKAEYKALALKFLKEHFGDSSGVTQCFPCMQADYPEDPDCPDVPDSRVLAKNRTEYEGLESLAMQYHAAGQYEYAYQHWLLAAYWRYAEIVDLDCNTKKRRNGVDACIRHALHNESLFQ